MLMYCRTASTGTGHPPTGRAGVAAAGPRSRFEGGPSLASGLAAGWRFVREAGMATVLIRFFEAPRRARVRKVRHCGSINLSFLE